MAEFTTVIDTVDKPAHASFVEKKSEFVSDICHINSLAEVAAIVDSVRLQHPKARHVAFAAISGGQRGTLEERMSDDGEPSGTAGKPILDVLRAQNLTDCVICVTRYFGGILLGSGGLIRAYATAANNAVRVAHLADIAIFAQYTTTIQYSQIRMFQHLLTQLGGSVVAEEYLEQVALSLQVPQLMSEAFESSVRETFNANVTLHNNGTVNQPVLR